ncbi:glyoxalase [Bryobacterales bacterium F-183]|nr:glyoxalase [Bryobacterales bacterium F-183]
MNRPVHFEIPANNPETIMNFFSTVFGWKFDKWDGPTPYWMVTTGPTDTPGINGGIMPRRDPAQPMVNTLDVENLDATLDAVAANGGTVVVPKMPVPSVGWLAYFKDPEGNIHGAMQNDPNAK